jgi:hypothetical protein
VWCKSVNLDQGEIGVWVQIPDRAVVRETTGRAGCSASCGDDDLGDPTRRGNARWAHDG